MGRIQWRMAAIDACSSACLEPCRIADAVETGRRAARPPRPAHVTRRLAAQAFQHAIERIQVGVVDHQPALAAAAVQHVDLGAERFRQFALQRGDVGLRLGLGRLGLGVPSPATLPAASCCTRCSTSRTDQPCSAAWRASAIAACGASVSSARAWPISSALGFHQHADLGRQLQQAQQVGHRGARTADRIGGLRVGEVEFVDQALQRDGFLQRIEVFALDVLDQRHRDHGAVVDFAHHHRDLGQAGQLRRAPAAFAGDDLVALAARCRARRSAGSRPAP